MQISDLELAVDGKPSAPRYNRIRNWTKEGLIPVIAGTENQGTGRAKEYPAKAVDLVITLEDLSKLGVKVAGKADFVRRVSGSHKLRAALALLVEAL